MMELDRDEFFDVFRCFRPDTTREEFEQEWAEFQRCKAEHLKRRSTN